MAARATIFNATLTAIADAIRSKTGKTASMLPSAMPDEILGITTGVDTSDATATAADVRLGKIFYANGARKTGTIRDVAAPTPSISVSSAGLITASATQIEGYAPKGTRTATHQLATQGAQTITPGTTDRTITSGQYLTGTQTIKGDANLIAENIKAGVSIFGVEGTYNPIPKLVAILSSIYLSGTLYLQLSESIAGKEIVGFGVNLDIGAGTGETVGLYLDSDGKIYERPSVGFLYSISSDTITIYTEYVFNTSAIRVLGGTVTVV